MRIPGGAYLDERLMTGEAVCVFWPHSWGSIPGLKQAPRVPQLLGYENSEMRVMS